MTSVNADTLRDSASGALDKLRRAAAPALKAAAPALKEGKRQAGALLDQGGEVIDTVSTRASKTTANLGKGLITYTRKNPLTALLLAVGAGALLVGAAKAMHSRR
jgi:hypothetical protein